MNPQPPTTGCRPPLVILGASCRFAAESAARAGWHVYAADLFGDSDLAAVAAATRRVEHYPDGLVGAAATFPDAPWCYTGAVENHLDVIDQVTMARPLAGNASAAVRRVRDPAALARVVHAAGLRYPETRTTAADVPVDGSFLRKPAASAGGRGITPWTGGRADDAHRFVWQRRIAGEPVSAVFALTRDAGRLVGLSRQLVGPQWCHGAPFAYGGSIRIPLDAVSPAVREHLAALAAALASRCGLMGIVGVDAVLEADGRLTVIEVNPRPTASAELCERATGESIMATHLAAFGYRSPAPAHRGVETIWSKAIVFAAAPVTVDVRLLEHLGTLADPWTCSDGRPALADIPRPGHVIRAHAPVITVFACGQTECASAAELRRRVDAVRAITG